MIKGKDLNLYVIVGGTPAPFLHSTDCTLKTSADILETTTKSALTGKTFEYARKTSFTIDINGFCELLDPTNFYTIQLALQNSAKVVFTFTDNNNIIYSGVLLVTGTTLDSPLNAAANFQGTFQGDGDYQATASPPPSPPVGYNVIIKDQFGNTLATVPAPGVYNVVRFDTIDCHSIGVSPDLIIIAG